MRVWNCQRVKIEFIKMKTKFKKIWISPCLCQIFFFLIETKEWITLRDSSRLREYVRTDEVASCGGVAMVATAIRCWQEKARVELSAETVVDPVASKDSSISRERSEKETHLLLSLHPPTWSQGPSWSNPIPGRQKEPRTAVTRGFRAGWAGWETRWEDSWKPSQLLV